MSMGTVAAIVVVAGTAITAGSQIYGANQQQKANERAANYNYALARNQIIANNYQARLQAQQFRNEAKLAQNQAGWVRYQQGALETNAKLAEMGSRDQAAAITAQAGEQMRRERDDRERRRAEMKSAYTKTGLTLEGTPIAVLNDAADRDAAAIQDIFDTGNNQRQEVLADGTQRAVNFRMESRGLGAELARLAFNAQQAKANAKEIVPRTAWEGRTLLARSGFERRAAHDKTARNASYAASAGQAASSLGGAYYSYKAPKAT